VAGIQLTISIPSGVTPVLNPDGSVDVASTLVVSSSAPANYTLTSVKYTAGSSLTITGIDASGFGPSDSITINMKVNSGSYPTGSDFKILSFEAYDIYGAALSLNPALATTIQ